MFNDSQEGQTHFYGDSCGELEHNQKCRYCKKESAQIHGLCKKCCPCCQNEDYDPENIKKAAEMLKENRTWEDRVLEICKGDPIAITWIAMTNELLSKAREEEREKFRTIIKLRLKYCLEQNGLPYCKNCGLKEI